MVVFNDYYRNMDELEEVGSPFPLADPKITGEDEELPKSFMTPKHLGTGAHPFQHQLQALNARIKEGAGRIELNFPGRGKGTSQAPTPESYGRKERRAMRELAKIAEVETNVHASFNLTGFSGLGERGFSDQQQEENLKELKKAIEFAAEGTTGGAVVMHTGEFPRDPGMANTGDDKFSENEGFRSYQNEEFIKREGFYDKNKRNKTHYVVDEKNGQIVQTYNEDQEFYEPVYYKAEDEKYNLVGKKDSSGHTYKKGDFIGYDGKWLNPNKPKDMFDRIPKFKSGKTEFNVQKYGWKELQERSDKWNEENPNKKLSPAQYKAREDIMNQAFQARASSIYHGQQYEELQSAEKALNQATKSYKKLEGNMSQKELWKIMEQDPIYRRGLVDPSLVNPTYKKPSEILDLQLREVRDRMRHVHESSASSDAKYAELKSQAERVKPIEEVALKRSADAIGRAGVIAMNETNRWKPDKPVYVAPENLWAGQYGSHPKEIIDMTKKSRNAMVERLKAINPSMSKNEAERLAKQHIKSTIDIGHLNLWKQYYRKEDPNMSAKQRDKEFKKWMLKWTKKMIDEDVLGHIHVSDNFGYDDEHLTPGEGNAPIKEFLNEMEKKGYRDVIIEMGSFNPTTAMHETWQWLDSPVYAAAPRSGFRGFHQQHFGNTAPPFYVVGGYAPSNEWRLWSEVPLE